MRTKRLGDMLLELGLITQEQLKQALEFQSREKGRLGSILIEHNFITERQLIDALRMQLGIEYIDLTKVDIAPEMSRYVLKNLAKRMSIGDPVRLCGIGLCGGAVLCRRTCRKGEYTGQWGCAGSDSELLCGRAYRKPGMPDGAVSGDRGLQHGKGTL